MGIGLAAMYGPTVADLYQNVWSTDEQGHGPIVLALCIWLIWKNWGNLVDPRDVKPAPWLGWSLVAFAAVAYVIGRSQLTQVLEAGSAIPLLVGVVLLLRGPRQLKAIWFPLFFMIFLVPLPDSFVDAVTQPMKMGVSFAAENVLRWSGYPIARAGVMLHVGQYQLLVADACAGLHTLFTLEAMGLLYLNLVRHSSVIRNIGLAILIVPISFAANVLRVVVLCLVTYHLGDEAGQGFLHGFAGMVLFMSALLLIISVDSALRFGGTIMKRVPA